MSKSKDAFRTISEVADWLETPAHVLRFWESKFTQVKPVKRAGGRRYYRPADMKLLGGIKKLLHDDGLTIKGAQKLLREHGVKHVADLSQPLEDDLLDEDEIAEAAYEPNAQPEPMEPEPSTVLSFPNRAETSAEKPSVAATPVPEAPAVEPPAPTPEVEAPAAATSESIEPTATPPSAPEAPKSEPAAAQTVTETATEEPEKGDEDEAPAFGTDALPAFLRRSSAPKEVAATLESEASPEKVAIDPVARFEPIEASEPEQEDAPEPSVAPAAASESPAPVQQPIFSHRGAATAPPDPEPEAKPEQISAATPPEPTPLAEPTEEAVQPKPALDVPPLSKVAPELSSYEAPAGVLAALPGSRRLAPDLAHQLGDKLGELRALRDRMQNH